MIILSVMLHLFITVIDGRPIMDEDDVFALTQYLLHGIYPGGFNRDDKRSLRQKSSSFFCELG